jgi:hypothetical protein
MIDNYDEFDESMPQLERSPENPPEKSHVVYNYDDSSSLKELLIRLLYNMPILDQHEFCMNMQKRIIDLNKEEKLHINPHTENVIYDIIHAENDPVRFMLQFVEKLRITKKEKTALTNRIFHTDLYNKDELYTFVNNSLDHLDIIPTG